MTDSGAGQVADKLAAPERVRLAELEDVVAAGLDTFLEIGNALMEIRDERLYRETHATFKSYCAERWGFSDSRGRQLIAAAKTVTDVTLAGLSAPKTEGEARRVARELREKSRPVEEPGRWAWIYGDFEAAIRHIADLESREARLDALFAYAHARRLPRDEVDIVKAKSLCALVGVEPLIQTMPLDRDPAIRHVWLGYLDGDELRFHPGWLRYCLEIGGQDARLANTINNVMTEEGTP